MKLLFVIPRNKSLFGDEGITAHPHIGVAYLSAFLKQNNISVSIFDEGMHDDSNRLDSLIDAFAPDIIGVTIFSYCYNFANDLIRKIKEKTKIPIVIGGPHVSSVGKKSLEDFKVEFAVKQEGEHTLLELVKALEIKKTDLSNINGLIWEDETGHIRENPDREFIMDLDKLPFPDYDAFVLERYVCYRHKLLPIITSRGCPFGCNYCSVRLSMGQCFRSRSAQNVFQEIRFFYDRGFRNFDVNDDCFTLDKKRAEAICDMIIQDDLGIRFQLYNGIRVDTVTKDLLLKMKHAGCYFISYGCEAGSQKVLKAIKKGITLQQVRDAVRWANEAGLRNSVNFIIGHKDEAYEDALETINFARSLPTDFVNFYNLLPYPGTESFEWARQHANFLVPPDSFLENISYRDNKPIFETREFTGEQREKIVAMGFDLYRKKILTFRLGRFLGLLVYWFTKAGAINRLATHFALNNPIGRAIYMRLSKKSYA